MLSRRLDLLLQTHVTSSAGDRAQSLRETFARLTQVWSAAAMRSEIVSFVREKLSVAKDLPELNCSLR